jgi:pyrroloquinoline quinone biosynthesis protein A
LYSKNRSFLYTKENIMWTTPAATEMRFGFEVTMYVMNK